MKLQPNETANSLMFALRLTEVSRWGIVAMSRQQSVGEHSFRVCMIAQAFYDYVFTTPHNSNDRQLLVSYAMCHDIMEVLSGDLDTVFKTAMKSRFPDVYQTTVHQMALQRPDATPVSAATASVERAVRGTFIEVIVKLSDFLEALIYLDQYGTNARHVNHVRDTILEHMWTSVLEFQRRNYNGVTLDHWLRVNKFIDLVLDRPGLLEKTARRLESEINAAIGESVGKAYEDIQAQEAAARRADRDTSERSRDEYRG